MQNRNTPPRGTYYAPPQGGQTTPQGAPRTGYTGARPATPQRSAPGPQGVPLQRTAVRRPAPQSAPRQGRPQGSGGVQPPVPPKAPTLGRAPGPSPLFLLIGLGLIALIGGLMQFVIFPNGLSPRKTEDSTAVTEIVSTRGVWISEVMTSNGIAQSDETNEFPDWVEITNTTDKAVDLSGWSLTDKLSRANHFVFPEGYVLQPGEYALVFCSGRLQDAPGSTFHAPFKLSSSGDAVILTDESGTVVESVNVPALGKDQSFARKDLSTWQVTDEYTPGLSNTSLSFAALTTLDPVDNSPLRISEVMPSNGTFIPCADGLCYDWIELYNGSSEPIDLSGYGLSDKEEKPSRWRFPAVTIAPGEYLIVYASGLDKAEGGELHTSFRLRAEGESVLLYNARGQLLDYVTYDNMKKDQSYALFGDGMRLSSQPTPGGANK